MTISQEYYYDLAPGEIIGEPPDHPTYVYFARCGKFLKIGLARSVARRIGSLQTANAHKVKAWLAIKYETLLEGQRAEREFHRQFSALHQRGEWFRLESALVAFIRSSRREVSDERS